MTSPQLEYAPAPKRRFRLRFRWAALLLLLAAGGIWWQYGKQIRDQGKLRWTVYQCTSFSRPEDSVAYEANRYYANELAAKDSGYKVNFPQSIATYGQFRGAFKPVDAWDAFPGFNVRIPGPYFPVRGGPAFPTISAIIGAPTSALFVHERRYPGRPARLIVVELIDISHKGGLNCFVIDPAPLWGKPALIWQGSPHQLGETISDMFSRAGLPINANEPPARIYFGQVDPTDSSKFTFRVSVLNADFKFEGRLLADDMIEIEGPLLSEVLSKIAAVNGGRLR